jgi:hypothetical protein
VAPHFGAPSIAPLVNRDQEPTPNTSSMKKHVGKPKATAPASLKAAIPVSKWWTAVNRLVTVQLVCSLLMQLSYVAFPAYNFALALWCLACCTPLWSSTHPKLVPFHMLGIGLSVIVDLIWMGLWVSGRVFYDQFCGTNGVSIVSCGGATDYFPGCGTNRFALFALVLNDIAKIATIVAMQRIFVLTPREQQGKAQNPTGGVDKTDSARTGPDDDEGALHLAIHPVDMTK